MTVKELLSLYSNWNIPMVINDDNLQPICRKKTIQEFCDQGGNNLISKLKVVSFSVVDGELAIRVELLISEIEQIMQFVEEYRKEHYHYDV